MPRRGASILPLLLLACAPPPSPAAPAAEPSPRPPASASASASASAGPVEAPTPLPVAAPGNLVLAARTRPLGGVIEQLGGVLGLPVGAGAMARRLGGDVLRMDAGAGAVALLAPGEEGIPSFFLAFSLPIAGEPQLKAAMERSGGQWTTNGTSYTAQLGAAQGLVCKPVISLGDAPLRLVCGASEQHVAQAAPYLTRGVPLLDAGKEDLWARVTLGPLKERLLPGLRGAQENNPFSNPPLGGGSVLLGLIADPALLAAPGAVIDEGIRLIEETDAVTLGAMVEGDRRQIKLRGRVHFAGKKSWVVRLLTTGNKSPREAPELFWQLPKESGVALHGRGFDASLMDAPRRAVRSALSLLLEHMLVSAADRKLLDDALAAVPQGDVPWALAAGRSPGGKAATAEERLRRAVGWWTLGSEAPAEGYRAWLRKTAKVLQRWIAVGKKSGQVAIVDHTPTVRVDEAPGGLPRGSVLVEVSGRATASEVAGLLGGDSPDARPNEPRSKVSLWLAAIPDGARRSWLVVAADRALLKARVAQVLTGAAKAETLAGREDAAALRGEATSFGGLVVPGAWAESGALAGKFETPLLVLGEAEADRVGVELRLQRGTVQDALGALMKLLDPG